jgi:hypothetical protein
MLVPQEAKVIWGGASLPSKVEVIKGGVLEAQERIKEDIEALKRKSNTFELLYEGAGPVEDSFQIRYYESEYAKAENDIFFDNYVMKGDWTFVFGDAMEERETESLVAKRQVAYAKRLRLREEEDVPETAGNCIEKGFIASDDYKGQEIVYAGLYIPSIPDVTFSISSNKNAYSDLKKEDFETMKREELGLLARTRGAQEIQGSRYPQRTVLREGKRTVQHWQGEESLVRRADGTHDFAWAVVGTPKDVANPSEFGVQMFTKVADNMVGAADKASLSDEEAIALWDKILFGLKFRVRVPGAPGGSYYFPSGAKPGVVAKP